MWEVEMGERMGQRRTGGARKEEGSEQRRWEDVNGCERIM